MYTEIGNVGVLYLWRVKPGNSSINYKKQQGRGADSALCGCCFLQDESEGSVSRLIRQEAG